MASEGSLLLMVAGVFDTNRSRRGGRGGGIRNAWASNMGEGLGVLMERGLRGAGGCDFESGGGEQHIF